jgi:phosphatidylinositol-3-phosphatase
MTSRAHQWTAFALALAGAVAVTAFSAHAGNRRRHEEGRLGTIFVIAVENHNWTQPAEQTNPQQIFMNPNAPFINSLVNGTSGVSDQVSYATNYLNSGAGIHPSEPNYIWAEAGTNFGVANDDDPCASGNQQNTNQHLTAFLMRKRISWRSYQEDTDIDYTNNQVLPRSQWTVPLVSHSGTFSAGGSFNLYNYSDQFNYAAKHNPMVFFSDTAGCDTSPSNPMRFHYAPLQQLALDLQNDDVADYNWITPNQYNDQHSALTNGYGGPAGTPNTGQASEIAAGDNFVARLVPLIMASDAYKDHGAILLWWDESEGGDDAGRTLPFIVISKDAHPNVGGLPYASSVQYSHSSTLRTMQEVFDVDPDGGFPFLGDASVATDLKALFRAGVVKRR